MSNYRRQPFAGGTYFFTVALADRQSALLVTHIQAFGLSARSRVASIHDYRHLHHARSPSCDMGNAAKRCKFCITLEHHQEPVFTPIQPQQQRSESKSKRREKGIWQRRYWEHQIRDETDLQRHVDYTHYNPVKHGYVKCVRDWGYSSFHRYVNQGYCPADWGGKQLPMAVSENSL